MEFQKIKTKMLSAGFSLYEWEQDIEPDIEVISDVASFLINRLPSIGFMNTNKRLNAIFVSFENIENLIDAGDISLKQAMNSYVIACNINANFDKANQAFVSRAPRLGIGEIPSCPVARVIWQQITGRM